MRRAKERWRVFKQSEPGLRFQDRYYRVRGRSSGHGRVFNFLGGFALLLTGLSFAWVIFIAGLGLLAGESLVLARFFDRGEVALVKVVSRARNLWATLPVAVKALILVSCVSGLGYGAYYLASWWLG